MEEILELIRKNLTGDYDNDMLFLNSLYEEENRIIQNANATIEAINIISQEIENEETNEEEIEEDVEEQEVEEVEEEITPEEKEIDDMISELLDKLDTDDDNASLLRIENIISKVETLSNTQDEKVINCTFSNEIEKLIFEKLFVGDKQLNITKYKNDILYILYADILLKKKRKSAALEALDRAIYWNFLNREAREKKLKILYDKNQIVKYLENLKVLQQISYTPEDLAHVYELYGSIFDELRDKQAAYAAYKLSNFYRPDPKIEEIVYSYEDANPEFKNLSDAELHRHLVENEVQIGPNPKIIKIHRDITTEFLNAGMLDDAEILLQNDYNLTRDNQIAMLYNQLGEIKKQNALYAQQLEENNVEEIVEENVEPEKKKTTRKRTTTKKETPKKETTTKKAKTTSKEEESTPKKKRTATKKST